MSRSKLGQYLFNLALGFDQFINTILLGDPDESISGRLGRSYKSGKPKLLVPLAKWFVDLMFLICFNDKNHCISSIEPEETPKDKELWSWIKED